MAMVPVLTLASGAQEKLAKAYLEAAATGEPQALLGFYHPGELQDLRNRMLKILDEEAGRGGSTIRDRLFGTTSLEDLRRLTPDNFFLALARRAGLPVERIGEVKVLGVIDENSQLSHVVARINAPDPNGRGRVTVVSLVRYGKDWRVVIPYGIQARVDAALVASEGRAPTSKTPNSPEILQFLEQSSTTLRDGDCAAFFNENMSPKFRSSTSVKAFNTLIKECQTREDTRETYLSALELARRMAPVYEQEGTRAVYDLRGQGLPFERFVLEKLDDRWYVAE